MKYTVLLFLTLWMITSAKSQNYQQNSKDADAHYRDRQQHDRAASEYEAQGRAASSNSKFVGSRNLDDEARSIFRRRYYHRRRRPNAYSDPCYGRRSSRNQRRTRQSRQNEGRFLWDLNVQNYYNQIPPIRPSYDSYNDNSYDCEYYEGPGFGGGGGGGLGNFLALFSPGAPLNQQYRPPRPPRPQVPISGGDVDPGVDPENPDDIFDPVYEDTPNRPLYDESPRPPSVGQLIGGVSNTVNNAIQTISANRPGRGLIGEIIYEYGQLFRF